MDIVRAKTEDAAALTNLAFAAKRHWGYPENWMENWRGLLTIQPELINRHETYAAILDGSIVGFYALGQKGPRMDLLHLWVLPGAMGRGIGSSLFKHAVERARKSGCRELEIESDPNAVGFYQRMGAICSGMSANELDGRNRQLPILSYGIGR
ncbi:MAG: GNAT family N-acetyltransferase [Verrucomicrobiota bacterium]|jgi:ribosomal protein S18 acetylase RimI-like enzyme